MDPAKVQGIQEWLTPQNVKEVRSFLGFVNFYQCFIWDFSDIAKPLNGLTCKAHKWSWGKPEQTAFEALKGVVTSALTLVFPSDTGHFHLECDSSNFSTVAV